MLCVYVCLLCVPGGLGRAGWRVPARARVNSNDVYTAAFGSGGGEPLNFNCGHHFEYTHGLCGPAYRSCNRIFDHPGSCVKCVHSCCNCNRTDLLVLHDPVRVDDRHRDSCGPNGQFCCSCSNMDRPAIGCSHVQYGQYLE